MPLEISRSFFRGELGRGLCKKFNVKVLTKKGAMLRGAIGKRGRSKAEEGSDEKGSLEIVDYKAIYRSAILKAASLFESRNGHFPAPQELTPLAISEQCESVNERNFPPIIVSSWLAQNPGFLAEVLESVKKK
jgi:hypothetical protein